MRVQWRIAQRKMLRRLATSQHKQNWHFKIMLHFICRRFSLLFVPFSIFVTFVTSCTVIIAFGGLVILCAIAGNITRYSREIYSHLKSLLQHSFFPAIAGNCPSFVFPAIAGIFPRFNLGIVPGSTCVLSQVQPGNCPRSEHLLVKIGISVWQCSGKSA